MIGPFSYAFHVDQRRFNIYTYNPIITPMDLFRNRIYGQRNLEACPPSVNELQAYLDRKLEGCWVSIIPNSWLLGIS
jgi:hypothetical protein